MGMIPFWRFPSDAGTTLASSTASAGFAASNVQKQTLQKKWKSEATAAFENIIIDLGSSIDIDTMAAFGIDFLSTDTIRFQMSDDPTFVSGVTTVIVTWHDGYSFETFDTVNARYISYIVTKTVAATSREVGRLMAGTSEELELGLKTPGDMFGPGKTTSTKQVTSGGQQYGNLGVSINMMRGTLPGLLAADITELITLQEAYQTVTSFVTVIREGLTSEAVIYGTLDNMNTPRYVTPDRQEIDWRITGQK